MTTGSVVALVLMFLAVDALVIGAVITMVAQTLGEFAATFPARPKAPDAVRREFQGIGLDLLNLGGSVHISVDEHYLHIDPVWIMRAFRMPPASIPWESIQLVKRGRRWWPAKAKVGKFELRAPDWCLALAEGKSTE
ncbi:MAG: hypothetical protein AB7K52_11440 [Phycisphaerales bacterium]